MSTPSVVSINLVNPSPTRDTTVSYLVTFSEAVNNVDVSDFTVASTGSALGYPGSPTSSNGGLTWTVPIINIAGDGTLRLDLNGAGTGITSVSTNSAIAGGFYSGQTYLIDNTAPAIPGPPDMIAGSDSGISNSDNITSNLSPTIRGTGESDSTVTLYDTDGTTVLGTSVVAGGIWTITSSFLSNGSHLVSAKAQDAVGNISASSLLLSLNIDSIAPAQPGAPDLTAGSDSGSSNTDNITNDTTPTFIGTAEADSYISLYDGATLLGVEVATGGNWSFTSNALADGSHFLTLTATDLAGNVSTTSNGLTFTIDSTAPNAPSAADLASGSDSGSSNADDITNDTTPILTGTAESGSYVTLYDTDGSSVLGNAIATGGNWSITSSNLFDGTHILTTKATDVAGNVSSASSALTLVIDALAPTTTIASAILSADTGSSTTDFITKTAAQNLSGTLSANLTASELVEVSLDNGSTWVTATTTTGQNTWSLSGQTLAASNTLKVRVSDAAGNVGTALSQAYVLDTSAPAVTSVGVPANGTYATGENLDFTVNFNGVVVVNTAGGTPEIGITLDTGGTVQAQYLSGSGTTALIFRLAVQAGDQDLDGVTVGTLSVNGGVISDLAANNAVATLNSVGATVGVLVDGITVVVPPPAPAAEVAVLIPTSGTTSLAGLTNILAQNQTTLSPFSSSTISEILALTSNTAGSINFDTLNIANVITNPILDVLLVSPSITPVAVSTSAPVIIFQGRSGINAVINNGEFVSSINNAVTDRLVVGSHGNDEIRIVDGVNTQVILGEGNNLVTMGSGNSLVTVGSGSSTIIGGGNTIVQMLGSSSDYALSTSLGHVIVTNNSTQSITDISRIQYVQLDAGEAFIFAKDSTQAAVAALYETAFGRTADHGGLQYWFDLAQAGTSIQQIATAFTQLAEFSGQAALSDTQFIQSLYQNTFGRSGESSGVAYWADALAQGLTRADLIASFASIAANNIASANPTEAQIVGSVMIIENII